MGLAQLWGAAVQFGYEDPGTGLPKAFEYMAKAIELDPDFVDLHFNNAIFAVWMEWDWEKGEREFKKALEINPSDARTRVYYAHLLGSLQQTDEALIQGRIAAELEPFDPLIQSLYAVVFMFNRDWEAAMAQLDKALALDANHFFATQLVDMVAFHLGDHDRALQAFENYLQFPETFFDSVQLLYREQGFEPAYEHVLIEMEKQGYGVPLDYAAKYSLLGDYDKAMDWLEIGFQFHDTNMPYITTGLASFDSLYNHPRFLAIVEKMNLPLPKTE